MLVHGRRRVREGQREEFSNAFRAFAEVAFATPGVKAVFCFDGAGAAGSEASAFWHVVWAKVCVRVGAGADAGGGHAA